MPQPPNYRMSISCFDCNNINSHGNFKCCKHKVDVEPEYVCDDWVVKEYKSKLAEPF